MKSRGFSIIELMVSLGIFSVLLAVVFTFTRDMFSAREVVERGIELDTLRWYIRDSLDCRRTLQTAKNAPAAIPPFSCADFPRGFPGQRELIARPSAGGSGKGARISAAIANTRWDLRWYCSDNAMSIEYRPKDPRLLDDARRLPAVTASDVLVPLRNLNPEEIEPIPRFDASVGFAFLKNPFGQDKPEKCPPTSSLGSLIALAGFAANTVLNSAPVQNTALDDMKKQWGDRVPGLQQPINGQFGDLLKGVGSWKNVAGGSGAWVGGMQAAIGDAQKFAGKWMQDIATDALRKSGQQVMQSVAKSVISGKGIGEPGMWAQAFAVGAADNAAGALGAPPLGTNAMNALKSGHFGIWEIAANGSTLDSGLTLGAKVPLQMFVAVTDINVQIESRMQNATNIMVAGLQQGLPNNPVAQDAVKALWDLDSYLKNDAPQRFAEALERNVAAPMRQATREQIDGVKAQMAQKFGKMQEDLRMSDAPAQAKAQFSKDIEVKKQAILAQIENAKAQADAAVSTVVNTMKTQFAQQMAAMAGDGKSGIKATIEQYLKDLQNGQKMDPKAAAAKIATQVTQQFSVKFPQLNPGKLVPPEPPWRDLFEGGSQLCSTEFSFDPMRDFSDDGNPCGVVMKGNYPIFARTHGGRPVCCREVTATGKQATCEAHEIAWLGGAECGTPNEPLLGQGVSRREFLPALQGRGAGIAFGLKTMPSFGGMVPGTPPIPPIPHKHVVPGGVGEGGGKFVGVLQVSQAYASTEKYLGGFLRDSSPMPGASRKVEGHEAACWWANKTYSRHGEYEQPHGVTTKALCCPAIGY